MTKVLVVTSDDDFRELYECGLPFRVRLVTAGAQHALTAAYDQPDVIVVETYSFGRPDWMDFCGSRLPKQGARPRVQGLRAEAL